MAWIKDAFRDGPKERAAGAGYGASHTATAKPNECTTAATGGIGPSA